MSLPTSVDESLINYGLTKLPQRYDRTEFQKELITFLLGKKCGIMCKSNAVPQQESSAFLAGSSSSSVGQGEPVASEKRNRSPSAASEHASSLINWLVGGASNGARDHPPQGMQVAASLHLKKDKIRRSISRLTARMRVDTTAHVSQAGIIN
eukprot:192453-Pelagomonas_calceolata.AAC.1